MMRILQNNHSSVGRVGLVGIGRRAPHPKPRRAGTRTPVPRRLGRGGTRGPGVDRRGAIIVFALMAMLATTLMIAQLLKTSSISHRQLKLDEYRIQASLLADAGWSRATYQLKNQTDYTGEVWTVPSEELSPGKTAEVRLSITANPTKTGERILAVLAEYPVGRVDLVRVSRKFVIP